MGKLEQLIDSLSKNEKAYFKRWVPNSDKEKKFVTVFQLIEKKPSISTKQLVAKLGEDVSQKKLETLKSHLWSSLLMSLRDYHRKNDLQFQYNSRSDAIKVLRSKGQLDAALQDAKKLLRDCEEIGMFPEAVRTIEHIENIVALNGLSDTNAEDFWNQLYRKKERIGLHLAEGSRIRNHERRLKLLNDRLGATLKSEKHQKLVSDLQRTVSNEGISQNASVDVRFRYYQTQAIIARILNHRDNERQWFEKVFTLLDENPIVTRTYYTAFYIVALHNYVDALLFAPKLSEIPSLLNRMKTWLKENPINISRDFFFFANDTMAYHILAEDYENGLIQWSTFEEKFEIDESPSNELLIRFMTLGAVLCFWNMDYRRALSVLRSLLKKWNHSEESDLLDIAKTLEIICNYELGDLEHTEHLIGVYLRKNSPDELKDKMESLVVKAISNQLRYSKSSGNHWEILTVKLQSLGAVPDEKDKLVTFNFIKYAEEKGGSNL